MVNYCPNCGRRVLNAAEDRCIGCGNPLPMATPTGLLGRLLCWLGFQSRTSLARREVEQIALDRTTQYVWTDPKTGDERSATTLDAVPPEIRRQIEAARSKISVDSLGVTPETKFVFRDASGQERTYSSLDEMPVEVREMFNRFRRKYRDRS